MSMERLFGQRQSVDPRPRSPEQCASFIPRYFLSDQGVARFWSSMQQLFRIRCVLYGLYTYVHQHFMTALLTLAVPSLVWWIKDLTKVYSTWQELHD